MSEGDRFQLVTEVQKFTERFQHKLAGNGSMIILTALYAENPRPIREYMNEIREESRDDD